MEKHQILIQFNAESKVAKQILKQIDNFFTQELNKANLSFKIRFFKEDVPIAQQAIEKLESLPENLSKMITSSVSEAKQDISTQENFKEKFSSFVKDKASSAKEKAVSAKESGKGVLGNIKNKFKRKT
jgi:hypothetical protein